VTDKYQDRILTLISEKGPLGVNQLSRELEIPLSTMQQYLNRQSYFRKNENKKWDLPENVMGDIKGSSLALAADVLESSIMLLKTQLEEMGQYVDNVLNPLNTIKRGVKGINLAAGGVADKPSQMHRDIARVLDFSEKLQKAIKQNLSKIPDDYQDLYLNLDITAMIVHLGSDYINSEQTTDLTGVLLGETDELSENTIKVLERFQK